MIELHNIDCMEYMATLPDKAFDLAIVDPPYGIGRSDSTGKYGRIKWSGVNDKLWDTEQPKEHYWFELVRVSANQIVFGANNFGIASRGFIVWDKGSGFRNRSFAECEYASLSMDANARIFTHDPLANGDYINKIHPTQKPVALYKWLLKNYAKPGQRILDTHLGSGSIAIACHDMGYDLVGCELDTDYYNAAIKRLNNHQKQLTLLTP